MEANEEKRKRLRVVAIGASELKPDGMHAQNFRDFQQKIAVIGLCDVEILKPVSYLGMSFLDYCVLGGGEATRLDQEIHGILFPKIEFEYMEYCKKRGLDLNRG